MAQVKKTLKPSDPEVEICVNEEIKDGELQTQNEITEEKAQEVVDEFKKGGVLMAEKGVDVAVNYFKEKAKDAEWETPFIPEQVEVTEEVMEEPLDKPLYTASKKAIKDIYSDKKLRKSALNQLKTQYKVDNSKKMNNSQWPELINQGFSATRLLHDINTNNKVHDIKAKGIVKSANVKMVSMPTEIYDRQAINAGNALRELGKRTLSNLPPVNSDYVKYAAMKRAENDAANQYFAQATLADSQQHSENLAKQSELQRMYADKRAQVEAHNRGIQAAKIVALSELDAARVQGNRQSVANYMFEKQTEHDQNRQRLEAARLAKNRLNWQNEAESGFQNELLEKYGAEYNNAPNKNNYTISQWVALQPKYASDFADIKKRWLQSVTDKELAYTENLIPNNWMFERGGKIRSTSDQIKINKHKSFDRNWVDSNKAVRRAIEKMNDKVYGIIMKILS